MDNSQIIKEILLKIVETGKVEDSHIEIINQAINSDEKTSFQFGEKIINIGKGEGIQIGDRLYYTLNEEAIKVLIEIQNRKQKEIFYENITHRGTDTFVGRDDELREIAESLENNSQLVITSAVKSVTGMGGVGKTELALQYALRNQEKYRGGICWIEARSQEISLQILSFCRRFLNFEPPDDFTPKEKVDFCYSRWHEGQVLLIFDDVQSYNSLKSYLPPKNEKFKVIVTSRQRLGQLNQLKLKVLKPEEALQLLKQIIGEERVNQELATAEKLCQWLGYLPLGLELVARFLTVYETKSLEQVLQELNEKKLQARALLDPNLDDKDMTAQLGVASAFELSWEKLSQKGQQLGCYLSLFKAESFDWDWVELLYKPSPQNLSRKMINFLTFKTSETITVEELEILRQEELYKFALLQMINEEGQLKPLYICHPLVSLFFESKLEKLTTAQEFKRKFCQIMAKLATSIKYQRTKQKIEEFTIIAPHLITVATEMLDYADDNNLVLYFLSLGRFYEGQTIYDETEKWLKEGLTILKKRLGDKHSHVAKIINELGLLYQSQGKYEEAEPLLLQALKMNKKLLGDEHPSVASNINNLGTLYDSQGKYEEAEPLYLQALEMKKKLLGEEHSYVANSIDNLALLYKSQGKYEEAESLFLQALPIYISSLGENHPDTVICYHNFIGFLQKVIKDNRVKELSDNPLTQSMLRQILGFSKKSKSRTFKTMKKKSKSRGFKKEL